MTKRINKKKLCVLLNEDTYNKVFDFVQNNELITARLVPGAVVEMGINLFFKEVSSRPLDDIVVEYLTTGKPGVNEK